MLGIVGTLLGVIFGGLISWMHNRDQREHEIKKEKRELLLSKYEELHELLSKTYNCVNEMVLQVVSEAACGTQFDSKQIKHQMPLEQVSMLIEFYVPELKSDFEYIKKQTTFLHETICSHLLEENRTKQFLAESAVTVNELSKVTSKTIESMKATLAKSASTLLKNA